MKKVIVGEEKVVAIGPRYEDSSWGYFQFPKLAKSENGDVLIRFHNGTDEWKSFGRNDNICYCSTSDNGDSWQPKTADDFNQAGVLMPNGDRLMNIQRANPILNKDEIRMDMRIATDTIPSDKLHEKSNDPKVLPYPVGSYRDIWGRRNSVYRVDEMPDGLFENIDKWPVIRKNAQTGEVKEEWATIDWPYLAIPIEHDFDGKTAVPFMPQLWGSIKIAPDGTAWVATYLTGLDPENGAFTPYSTAYVLCSKDNGHSWKLKSWVNFIPDNKEYENAFMCGGYCEPNLEFAPDGTMVMLLRVTSVFLGDKEWAPMYFCYSKDNGESWTKPTRFDDTGVLPHMCRLGDTIMAIYGRPGIKIRTTNDQSGLSWDEPIEIMEATDRSIYMNERPEKPNFHQWAGSCCNCDIIALDDSHAMIAYSDFYHLCPDGVRRKSIKVRIISIEE